jgi:alkylation response protein AidB-like acyl-CoA dehydrogenase
MTTATATRQESPLEVIERLRPLIAESVDQSESQAELVAPIVDGLREASIFRQLAPASLGGGEVDPLTWYRTVEAAARIDGSTGWMLFIQGSTGLIGRNMPAEAAEAVVGDPGTILSGAIFPPAKAVTTDGGAVVSGRAPYASGCKHATHLIRMAVLHDGDVPRMSPMGPEMRIAVIPAHELTIVETWDVNGLRATGSHDIVADGVFVPDERLVPLMSVPNQHYQGALYRLPFLTMFGFTIAPVALGIAQHAIDATRELAAAKTPAGLDATPLRERAVFQLHLSEAEALVRSARSWLYESVARQWAMAQANQPVPLDDRVDLALAAANASKSSRLAVEQMYLACGGTANYRTSPLQRCLRDIQAVSQHLITNPTSWQLNGAMLAGLPPANPLILL